MRRLALTLAAAALAVLALAPAATASRSQEAILMDDARLVYGTDAQVEQTLDALRSLGVDRVRVSLIWKLLAPRPDDTARPSFDAADPRRGRRLRVFGQLRPAANGASLGAELQFRRRGSGSWRVVRRLTTRSFRNYLVAHVRARSSGSWRLAWRNPAGGGPLYSRAAKVRVIRRRR